MVNGGFINKQIWKLQTNYRGKKRKLIGWLISDSRRRELQVLKHLLDTGYDTFTRPLGTNDEPVEVRIRISLIKIQNLVININKQTLFQTHIYEYLLTDFFLLLFNFCSGKEPTKRRRLWRLPWEFNWFVCLFVCLFFFNLLFFCF